jgi:hypothetical protein
MSRKLLPLIVAVVLLAAAFYVGYRAGSDNSVHETIFVADCYAGASGGTCMVGDVGYGFESPPSWTDSGNVGHDTGWPTCLPQLHESKGVRFAGAWLQMGNFSEARVVWVDCRNR